MGTSLGLVGRNGKQHSSGGWLKLSVMPCQFSFKEDRSSLESFVRKPLWILQLGVSSRALDQIKLGKLMGREEEFVVASRKPNILDELEIPLGRQYLLLPYVWKLHKWNDGTHYAVVYYGIAGVTFWLIRSYTVYVDQCESLKISQTVIENEVFELQRGEFGKGIDESIRGRALEECVAREVDVASHSGIDAIDDGYFI
ncbi:hypothetical protein L1987_14959 [Smallanthus sonchifolius]|uniref:Uncharacterized protein n=1 Tax=Smallanthus sonchifolius TaxID=185202 RepID=A0ACB9J5A7_9ASTR|nr:hypothetical protein L1987_14959 [Smallanthus sonchifolius]